MLEVYKLKKNWAAACFIFTVTERPEEIDWQRLRNRDCNMRCLSYSPAPSPAQICAQMRTPSKLKAKPLLQQARQALVFHNTSEEG